MICVIIDKLIRTTIVSCPAVINWIFSEHMRVHFTEGFVWEILHGVLRKMNMEVTQLQKELEDVKHKKSDVSINKERNQSLVVCTRATIDNCLRRKPRQCSSLGRLAKPQVSQHENDFPCVYINFIQGYQTN